MLIYEELGERIERAFEHVHRDERAFPRIAAEALREARVPERSGADDVLAWLFAAPSLPAQNDLGEAFGEPPITVYRGRDFHSEVLFWLRTVTTVHTHGFSGAFQALAGDRLQTRHAFDVKERFNARILLGDVRFLGAELLRPGDVVEITNDLAHALVHLEAPSATIVVRTASDPNAGPQYDYRAPGLAWDAFHVDELRERKLQGLRLLCRLGRADALVRAVELVACSDLGTCLGVLDVTYRTFGTTERIAKVATFTGSAFRVGKGATPILLFRTKVMSLEPKEAWEFDKDTPRTDVSDWCQGAVLRHGKGRVAVFGEAAMFSAQLGGPDRKPMGMNSPVAAENARFLLNVAHWLTGLLGD